MLGPPKSMVCQQQHWLLWQELVDPEKTEGPMTLLVFLKIEADTSKQGAASPKGQAKEALCLNLSMAEPGSLHYTQWIRKKQAPLSLTGLLSYAAMVARHSL